MSGVPLTVLVGRYVATYRDGIAGMLTTPWEVAAVPDSTTAGNMIGQAQAVVTTSYGRSWPSTPKLRLLQVASAGYDRVDLSALPPGVTVCNVYGHVPAVAEYALLGMLEWCHRLAAADHDMRAGVWTRSPDFAGAPHEELAGKTLLVVGLGRIGRAIVRRAAAFDMRIIAANRTANTNDPNAARVVDLDRLSDVLKEADFVVLACALAPETRGLIDAEALAAMKPGAVILNFARGPVIDEAALYEALAARRIGGAVLDTWWDIPNTIHRDPSVRFPFHQLDNVLLSPHFAGWTTGTMKRRTIAIARNLDRLARGEPLANVVAIV